MSDREKISFSELDRIRREKRRDGSQGRPRGERAQQRSRAAIGMYKRKVEERLFGRGADAARLRLEERLRESHGSPTFHAAYKEYTRTHGLPVNLGLLVLLIDLDDEREVLRVLEAIEGVLKEAPAELRNLLPASLPVRT